MNLVLILTTRYKQNVVYVIMCTCLKFVDIHFNLGSYIYIELAGNSVEMDREKSCIILFYFCIKLYVIRPIV